jgi:hypothetical protein
MTRITGWRKSSFSGGGNNACLELANTLDAIRDSKNQRGGVVFADLRPLIAAASKDLLTR